MFSNNYTRKDKCSLYTHHYTFTGDYLGTSSISPGKTFTNYYSSSGKSLGSVSHKLGCTSNGNYFPQFNIEKSNKNKKNK